MEERVSQLINLIEEKMPLYKQVNVVVVAVVVVVVVVVVADQPH